MRDAFEEAVIRLRAGEAVPVESIGHGSYSNLQEKRRYLRVHMAGNGYNLRLIYDRGFQRICYLAEAV